MSNIKQRISNAIAELLDVASSDPDDARRRKLLNILLLGLGAASTVALPIVLVLWMTGAGVEGAGEIGFVNTVIPSVIVIVVVMVTYLINRHGSGTVASSILLLLLIAAMPFLDSLEEVSTGRSIMFFAIPIMMASVILHPAGSFVVALLSSVVVGTIAISLGGVPNVFAFGGFFLVALVSWLSSRGTQSAIHDLRALNLELDQRVEQRTGELSAILESIRDGVVVFDRDARVINANPSITSLLQERDVVGKSLDSLMAGSLVSEEASLLSSLIAGDADIDQPALKFDWGERVFSTSVAPVHLKAGDRIGTVAVFRDFTREAEIDRMKSTFVAIASHELRTPLNAIMGYAEMLLNGIYGDLNKQQLGSLNRIMVNIDHMQGLANSLLDRARIESGTLELALSEFNPADVVKEAVSATDVLASSHQLTLTKDVSPDLSASVVGDQQRLHQVLVNLIGNALKFTNEGGVHITADPAEPGWYTIAVSDTGIGIPEEAREYIFEPFRQADESATREYGGAGLGLSIVKQLVELMGGTISLESEVGKGSTFTLTMPVQVEEVIE